MEELHTMVQECKALGVKAMIYHDTNDLARYEHTFWKLMYEHGTQILDIVDDALTAHKEGKI